MSAGAPNDGIIFNIRAAKDELRADMAAAQAQVVSDARKISEAANAALQKTPLRLPKFEVDVMRMQGFVEGIDEMLAEAQKVLDARPLRPKFLGVEKEVRDSLAATLTNLKQQAQQDVVAVRANARLQDNLGFNPDLEARERFRGTSTAAAAAGGAALARSGGGAIGSVQGVLRGVGVLAAIESTKQTYAQINVIAAAISGEYEKQVAASKSLDDTIKAFPIIGEEALWLHKKINEEIYGRITGEKQYLDTIKEATRQQEIHTDILAKQAKAQANFYADQGNRVAGIGTAENPFATAEQKAQVEVNAQIAARDRIRDDPRNIDPKTKKRTATGQSQLEEADKRLNNLLAAAAIVRDEKMQQSGAEVEAARLRSIGEVAKAEELDFEAGLQKRERAAARESKDELDAARQTNNYLREIRKQRLEAEAVDEAAVREDQRQKARNTFEESLVELQEDQERAAKEAVRQMDDIADAEEAVRVASVSSVGLAPQSFVTSGASAMQGFFGPQGQRVIGDVQKATDYLRQIRDNGMMARAS